MKEKNSKKITWTKEKILNSNAIIQCGQGEIVIPMRDVVDESYIDEILKDAESDTMIDFELQDLVYEYFTSTLNINII